MYKSESKEGLLFPSPPHPSALVAWTPAPLTIFADQSHIMLLCPQISNYMYQDIWNKCWQTCQTNNHASKQGQVQISTDYSQRTVGFQLNRSTGPQLSISIGHSSQLSLLPYQTWRSYYERTLIVVSNYLTYLPLGDDIEDPAVGGKKG